MSSFSIQGPVLVFDEIQRRSGTIERDCVIRNARAEALDLSVRFDFAEHSWVQLYMSDGGRRVPIQDGRLRVQPGESRLSICFNTDNFSFPDASFRGRISFAEGADLFAVDWIEINFESVRELAPFQGWAAIDIGTTTSTISLYHVFRDAASRSPRTPPLEGGDECVPSAVFISDAPRFLRKADGGCAVGTEALAAYHDEGSRAPLSLQIGTKRLVGSEQVLIADAHGAGAFVDPLDVLQALGRHIRERAQRLPDVRALIDRVSVTFPPTWSYRQIGRWRELFRRLGFRDEQLDLSLDEASAAALFHIFQCVREPDGLARLMQDLLDTREAIPASEATALPDVETAHDPGGAPLGAGSRSTLNLLCFDFGGGTIDLARVEVAIETFERLIRLRLSLVGSDSLEYGGDRVTLAIFRMLKRRIALAIADPERARREAARADDDASEPANAERRTSAASAASRLGGFDEEFLLPDRFGPRVASAGAEDIDPIEVARRVLAEARDRVEETLDASRLEARLEDAVEALFPTRFLEVETSPVRISARRNFDWLWRRAELAKRRLFDEVREATARRGDFPRFEVLAEHRVGIALRGCPHELVHESIGWARDEDCERVLALRADEIFAAIKPDLERALERARRLAADSTVHRVVLSGQSSRIPMVAWMFGRSRRDGGLGLPASKVIFDPENAKRAVSQGACVLHMLRETLVGYEVDVADFTARLLGELFYRQVDGSRRVLFAEGAIDDFAPCEDRPLARGFPGYLSVHQGADEQLVGHFAFASVGRELPPAPELALEDGVQPTRAELVELRGSDRRRYGLWASALLELPDLERIAWMERGVAAGSRAMPVYRFYLTRQHRLWAVRDRGEGEKRILELERDTSVRARADREEDPFSGVH